MCCAISLLIIYITHKTYILLTKLLFYSFSQIRKLKLRTSNLPRFIYGDRAGSGTHLLCVVVGPQISYNLRVLAAGLEKIQELILPFNDSSFVLDVRGEE